MQVLINGVPDFELIPKEIADSFIAALELQITIMKKIIYNIAIGAADKAAPICFYYEISLIFAIP